LPLIREYSNVKTGAVMTQEKTATEKQKQVRVLRQYYSSKIEKYSDTEIIDAWNKFLSASVSRPYISWLTEESAEECR
jgi:hypothetical protein